MTPPQIPTAVPTADSLAGRPMGRSKRAIDHNQCQGLSVALFEESEDAMMLLDGRTLQIVDVNAAAQRLSGMCLRDLLEAPVQQQFRFGDREDFDLGHFPGRKVRIPHQVWNTLMRTCRTNDWIPVDMTVTRLAIKPQPIVLLTLRSPAVPIGTAGLASASDAETICERNGKSSPRFDTEPNCQPR